MGARGLEGLPNRRLQLSSVTQKETKDSLGFPTVFKSKILFANHIFCQGSICNIEKCNILLIPSYVINSKVYLLARQLLRTMELF